MTVTVLETPVGPLYLAEEEGRMTRVSYAPPADAEKGETPLLREAGTQLKEYFAGTRKAFDLPLEPRGTEFFRRVWRALEEIPYGETRSYREVAARVGNPKACRAVGLANNRNPLAILIPCHRVVGRDGKPVGYAGGLDKKEFLLELERRCR